MKYENEKRSKRISLVVTPSDYEKMKKLVSEEKSKSMSDFINFLIGEYFKQEDNN